MLLKYLHGRHKSNCSASHHVYFGDHLACHTSSFCLSLNTFPKGALETTYGEDAGWGGGANMNSLPLLCWRYFPTQLPLAWEMQMLLIHGHHIYWDRGSKGEDIRAMPGSFCWPLPHATTWSQSKGTHRSNHISSNLMMMYLLLDCTISNNNWGIKYLSKRAREVLCQKCWPLEKEVSIQIPAKWHF